METKIVKRFYLFFLFFIIFLPISYLGVSLMKQILFEHKIKDEITILEKENLSYEENDKNLDYSDMGRIFDYGRGKVYFVRYYYILGYEKFIINESYHDVSLRLFDIYCKQNNLNEVTWISGISAEKSDEYFWDTNEKNYVNRLYPYIAAWEKEGGKKDGNWWKEFERSSHYRRFLDDAFSEMEKKENTTLDDTYRRIMNINEQFDNPLKNYWAKNYSIPFYKWLGEFAYKRYLEDKKNGDYMAALVDSETIYVTWIYWIGFRDAEITTNLGLATAYLNLTTPIYLDVSLILVIAFILDLAFLSIWISKTKKK